MKCSSNLCSQDAVIRVLEVRNRRAFGPDQFFCEEHATTVWDSHVADNRTDVGVDSKIKDTGAFDLELMWADQRVEIQRVLLREIGTSRLVILPLPYLEICVLHQSVHDSPYNQWTLHVVMAKIIKYFGGNLAHVIIDDIHPQGFFIAKAVILHNEKWVEVQIRPSEGLTLAILADIPFLVAENVLSEIAKTGKLGRS